MQGKSIKVIIDGRSCHNHASQELCAKLGLKLEKHPHPYHVQWLSECGTVKVQYMTKVTFQIGAYADTVECDVVPMTVCHLLLGRPWQYDRAVTHDGRTNHYKFKWHGQEVVLHPMTPSQIVADNAPRVATCQGEKVKNESRPSMSENHKTHKSGQKKGEGRELVMLATKLDWR